MIWVINHAELDLNHCMIFVNISKHKPQLRWGRAAVSLIVQKTLHVTLDLWLFCSAEKVFLEIITKYVVYYSCLISSRCEILLNKKPVIRFIFLMVTICIHLETLYYWSGWYWRGWLGQRRSLGVDYLETTVNKYFSWSTEIVYGLKCYLIAGFSVMIAFENLKISTSNPLPPPFPCTDDSWLNFCISLWKNILSQISPFKITFPFNISINEILQSLFKT